jgi:septal ring factor EnvC (AmiA/AmiB activator)
MPYRVTFLVMIASLAFGCESAVDKRVARLEQELMQVQNALTEAEFKVQQSQVSIEMLTHQLVRVKVERDKLKQELAALAKAQ